MVSNCANHDCRRELHYLRDGKLYQFVLLRRQVASGGKHFWLYGECSKTMTLTCVDGSEVKIEGRTSDRLRIESGDSLAPS